MPVRRMPQSASCRRQYLLYSLVKGAFVMGALGCADSSDTPTASSKAEPPMRFSCSLFASMDANSPCSLMTPSEYEQNLIRNEASRLQSSGSVNCRDIGDKMMANRFRTYMNENSWYSYYPSYGGYMWASGDYHPSAQEVHLARRYGGQDGGQYAMTDSQLLQNARHENAHATGIADNDAAETMATYCSPNGPGSNPVGGGTGSQEQT